MAASACLVKLDCVQTVSLALPVCAAAVDAAARVPPATASLRNCRRPSPFCRGSVMGVSSFQCLRPANVVLSSRLGRESLIIATWPRGGQTGPPRPSGLDSTHGQATDDPAL